MIHHFGAPASLGARAARPTAAWRRAANDSNLPDWASERVWRSINCCQLGCAARVLVADLLAADLLAVVLRAACPCLSCARSSVLVQTVAGGAELGTGPPIQVGACGRAAGLARGQTTKLQTRLGT